MQYFPTSARLNAGDKFNQGRNLKPMYSVQTLTPVASNVTKASNDQDSIMMKSVEFLKHILQSQYVRGDRVCMKNLFLHISKAPPEIQKQCGRDIKDFKQFLSKFPETFAVKNNYVCLNIFEDEICCAVDIIENMVSAQRAIDEIRTVKEIGLKLQGSLWGLTGKISLITVALPSGKTIIFDVIKCPNVFTGTNLGGILESDDILKVTHNCQNDVAAILGTYGVQTRNVFDLQCAFKTIQLTNPQMLDESLRLQYLNLNNILDYYEFRGDKVVEKEEVLRKLIKKNPNVWFERPLGQDFYEYSAANVSPLLVLYSKMKTDRALKINKTLFQNLVYEELFRFATPLIIKRRQNVRQTSLRSWKRQMANEFRYISYIERSSGKDQIWRNDYSIPPHVTAKLTKTGQRSNQSDNDPRNSMIQDLDTKYFLTSNKRYYFDIKEQKGVKFVKISEISSIDQSRNLISINLNLVPKFRDCLQEIQQIRKPNNRGNVVAHGTTVVHALSIVKDTRRYLVDLKRNYRGYFVTISQMLPTGGKLSSIAFSLRDLSTFVEVLYDIGREFEIDEASINDGNYMRFRNKRYFFNVNQNQHGTFMRISEVVSPKYQSSITISEKSWDDFLRKMAETCAAFRKLPKSDIPRSDGELQELINAKRSDGDYVISK